jgi:hypothetical protein
MDIGKCACPSGAQVVGSFAPAYVQENLLRRGSGGVIGVWLVRI